jgi:cell wall-associated NlpC family hydrolase
MKRHLTAKYKHGLYFLIKARGIIQDRYSFLIPLIVYLYIIMAVILSASFNTEEKKYLSAWQFAGYSVAQTGNTIKTGKTKPEDLVSYAKKLLGTPYLYGSADRSNGFDCSGFITYVFKHFHIKVPRSSVDFTNEGRRVTIQKSRPGDLILFTGTDLTVKQVGHMGIVISNIDGDIQFIHCTSGKAKCVVITGLEKYYKSRFVKVIRVFPETDEERKKNKKNRK